MQLPEPARLKALLFDLDGTLVNTDGIHFRVWRAMLADRGIRIDRAYFDENLSGGSNDEILQRIISTLSEVERAAFAEAKEIAFRQSATALTPTPGVGRLLDWAADADLKTAVVTSAEPENVDFMLGGLGLRNRFETIVMAGDAEFAKPHPMPFEMACRNLGVSPLEAVAFEDSIPGVTSASGSGATTVAIAPREKEAVLLNAGAKFVVADFAADRLWAFLENR